MTTEDDFQRELDANPDDFLTHQVFADWLEDHCDKRADGYRAMGQLRIRPAMGQFDDDGGGCWFWNRTELLTTKQGMIVTVWLDKLPLLHSIEFIRRNDNLYYPSRRLAEDALALVFIHVSVNWRAVLLQDTPAR